MTPRPALGPAKKAWAMVVLLAALCVWVVVARRSQVGALPPSPVAPHLVYRLYEWQGSVCFAVLSRRDAKGHIYRYQRNAGLHALNSAPEPVGIEGTWDGGRCLVLTKRPKGRRDSVALLSADGAQSTIARGSIGVVAPSPLHGPIAFVGYVGDWRELVCLCPGPPGGQWQETRWRWPEVTPKEPAWTPAGDLLVVAARQDRSGACTDTVYSVNTTTGAHRELSSSGGVTPYLQPLSPQRPRQMLLRTSSGSGPSAGHDLLTLSVVDVARGTVTPLLSGRTRGCLPSPSGKLVALALSGRQTEEQVPGPSPRTDGPTPFTPAALCVLRVGSRALSELTSGEFADIPVGFLSEREVAYTRAADGYTSVRACVVDGTHDREMAAPEAGEIQSAVIVRDEIVYWIQNDYALLLYSVTTSNPHPRVIHRWPR